MKSLTIDGRAVTVPDGATVLDAAVALGIAIPSLCHAPGLEASTSCMACVVRIDGGRNFAPSCATPARDGMVVESETDEVRAARRNSLRLLLSDHAGDCTAPCQLADDRHADLPAVIRKVGDGDVVGAAALLKSWGFDLADLKPDVVRRAQKACRRGRIDEAVAIDGLLRYVAARAADAPAGEAPPAYRSYSVRLGKMAPEELQVLLTGAAALPQVQPADAAAGFSDAEAIAEAQRCLHCDCRAAHQCKLRDACEAYEVDASALAAARPPLVQDRAHGELLHEPGKCIRCGLCLQVAEMAGEALGLSFAGRGFDMRVKVPFGEPLSAALLQAAEQVVAVCPTAALAKREDGGERRG